MVATKEDPDLERRRREREGDLAKKRVEDLTVAERLTLRALDKTIKAPFTDKFGKFEIEMKVPLRYEYDELIRLQSDVMGTDVKRVKIASEILFKMFDCLCIDESLNFEYWKSGAYDMADMTAMLLDSLTSETNKRVKQAQSFLKK